MLIVALGSARDLLFGVSWSFLGGLEFIGPAILGLLAVNLNDFMFLKDVSTRINGFGPPWNLDMELCNSLSARFFRIPSALMANVYVGRQLRAYYGSWGTPRFAF